jgi:putative OPT family oligopeptide transporter
MKNGEKSEVKPYIAASESIGEFSVKAVVLGSIFGLLFGFSNTYLGLYSGLTVSTSIPIAVMTIAAFRGLRIFGVRATILESNISQTIGSASSSLASGVIFTIPALFLWGANPTLFEISALALLGSLLGITFMIPLRSYLIVKEHHNLPFPEGTACANVLINAERGGAKALPVFAGVGIGLAYKFLARWQHLWAETVTANVPGLPRAEVGINATPALLSVGFILGYKISAVMVAGALISWIIIIPLIAYFGRTLTAPVFPETVKLIAEMSPAEIWANYVRYLGAGAVAMAGIITVLRSVPIMVNSFRLGAAEFRKRLAATGETIIERTSRDLPIKWIIGVVAGCVAAIAFVPGLVGDFTALSNRIVVAVAIAVFAFLFVTVSSRIVGLIGVSSNPTSGMTIVTLLGTSLIFYMLGWTDAIGKITALSVGTVVCVAASIAGDMSQDLKTGYLVGGTPRSQQIGEYIGALTSVVGVAYAVTMLNEAYGFGTTELPAPQAMLMKTVIDGVLSAQIPWPLIFMGAALTLVVELFGIASLPFAVGVYLPLSTMTPIFIGGLLRLLLEKRLKNDERLERCREGGVLFSSGLIAGEGLLMVGLSAYVYFVRKPDGWGDAWLGGLSGPVSLLLFVGLGFLIYTFARRHS